jgi:hypothetical protein
MSSILNNLSAPQLRKAAALREKIDSLEKELNQLFGSPSEPRTNRTDVAVSRKRGRRRMTADARAKIAAAAKARWKKAKAAGRNTL